MPVHFTVDPAAHLVTYVVKGHVTAADARDFLAGVLSHPEFRPGFNFLGDRRDEGVTPSVAYVQEVTRLVAENRRDLYPCRWAVLVSNELAYGMARMLGLMAGDSGIDIMPFYEVAQAAEWLDLSEARFTGVGIWPAVVA